MNDEMRYHYESGLSLAERTIRRLWILCIILVILLTGTNAAWLWYESQFIETEVTQDVDTGVGDATVVGVGDYYGESTPND